MTESQHQGKGYAVSVAQKGTQLNRRGGCSYADFTRPKRQSGVFLPLQPLAWVLLKFFVKTKSRWSQKRAAAGLMILTIKLPGGSKKGPDDLG